MTGFLVPLLARGATDTLHQVKMPIHGCAAAVQKLLQVLLEHRISLGNSQLRYVVALPSKEVPARMLVNNEARGTVIIYNPSSV